MSDGEPGRMRRERGADHRGLRAMRPMVSTATAEITRCYDCEGTSHVRAGSPL
jgi:hypothetical protein